MNIKLRCLAFAGASIVSLMPFATASAQLSEAGSLYKRLAEETTATALSLTDKQKVSIARILSERDEALAAAENEEARARVTADCQEKLAGVLTEEQQAQFTALFGASRIKFNFRFQKWADVLSWIAGEAGLSLVMEETPEGTFNYSDRREYEPDDAIDLLNGWLMVKGFTLIRRDQLLMCISLRNGIPAGTIPRIPLEELPKRGRFEFVTVLIPLEERSSTLVMKEIEPLVSAWGEATPLTATKQLLVTDAADIVRSIQMVAQAVPPPKPKQSAPAKVVPKPVLKSYPVLHANPGAVVNVLEKFVSGTMLLDETGSQITINAVPGQQLLAVSIMKRMEESQGPDNRPELKSYPVRTDNPDQMLQLLQLTVPSATVRYDSTSRRFVAFATSQDHQKFIAAMLELDSHATVGEDQLSVHQLNEIDPATVQQLINSVLPDVRVTVDPRTSTLIAVGRLSELRAVRTLIDQLQPESAKFANAVLQPYPITPELSELGGTIVLSIAPEATVTPDPANERLLIVAQPDDHDIIAKTLEKLSQGVAADGLSLKTYDVQGITFSSISPLLQTLVPDAQFIDQSVNQRLLAIASAGDHVAISNVLEQVRDDTDAKHLQLKSYPLPDDYNHEQFTSLVDSFEVEASVTVDSQNSRLMVTASAEDHQRITKLLEQLIPDTPAEKPQLKAYLLPALVDAETFTSMLTAVAKRATIRNDSANNRLLVTATEADHAAAALLLEQLTSDLPDSEEQLKSYFLPKQVSPDTVTSMLQALAADATVFVDVDSERVLVTATGQIHERVAATLEQLTAGLTEKRLQLKTFPLPDNVTSATVKTLLTQIASEATVTGDSAGKRILVTATAEDLAAIDQMLTQLLDAQDMNQRQLKSYPLKADIDPAIVTTLLKSLTPNAAVTADTPGHRLLITATAKDHESIDSAIDQITRDARGESPQLRYYPLERVDGEYAVGILSAIVPAAIIRYEHETQRLSVVGSLSDHEILKPTLKNLETATPEQEARELKVYNVTKSQRTRFNTVLDGLSQEIPDLQVLADGEPDEIIIWAKPSHHEIVDTVLDQLDVEVPTEQKPSLVVYPISKVDAESIAEVLREIFADATIKVDSRASRLLIRARPSMQMTIKSAIQQLDTEIPEGHEIKLMVYPVKGLNPETTLSLINTEIPNVSVIHDDTAQTFIIRGRLEEHQKVAQLLETLKTLELGTLKFYPVDKTTSSSVQSVLAAVVPEVALLLSSDGAQLFARVTRDQHTIIERTLAQLAEKEPFVSSRVLKIYSTAKSGTNTSGVLRRMVPAAVISVGSEADQLMIEATDSDHQRIGQLMTQLEDAAGDSSRQLQFYTVDPATLENTQATLSSVVPGVVLTTSTDGTRLIAHVSPDQHSRITEVLEQLKAEEPFRSDRSLRFYSVTGAGSNAITVLERMLPAAVINDGSRPDQLMVEAAEADHIEITELLAALKKAAQDEARSLRYYDVSREQLQDAQEILVTAVPGVDLRITADRTRLIALVTDEQDQQIAAMLEQLAAGTPRRTTRVFDISGTNPAAIRTALAPLATDNSVQISIDSVSKQVYVYAFEDRQQDIHDLLTEIMSGVADRANTQIVTYFVGSGNGDEAREALTALYPDVTFITDSSSRMIIAAATAAQHERIRVVADQISSAASSAENMVLTTYRIQNLDGSFVEDIFRNLFPQDSDVIVTVNEDTGQLVAIARPEQHETIHKVLQQIDQEADETAKTLRVYKTAPMTASSVAATLKSLVSKQTTISAETGAREIVVSATAVEHARIAEMLLQIGIQPEEIPRQLAVYRVAPLDTTTVINALEPLVSKHVTITPESSGSEIVVSAPPTEQKKIAELVQQIRSHRTDVDQMRIRTYRVSRGKADDAVAVLRPMFPDAKLATDRRQEMLIATALPEQHEMIAEIVRQISGRGDGSAAAHVKTYLMREFDGSRMKELLDETFTTADDVRITWDDRNRRIISLARPEQQEMIADIISELDPKDGPHVRHLREYGLTNLDLEAVNQVVNGAVQQIDPGAHVGLDQNSEKLMVTTHERGHEVVRDVVARFIPNEPKQLKIFQLSYMDPWEAHGAIDRMIASDIQNQQLRPDVHPDDNLQQLWVRATDTQLKEIEDLLVQLGEVGLGAAASGADTNLRVVPVGEDVEGAIRQIENLWPRVRTNPLRVLNRSEQSDRDNRNTPQSEGISKPGQFSVPPEDAGDTLQSDDPPAEINPKSSPEVAVGTDSPTDEPGVDDSTDRINVETPIDFRPDENAVSSIEETQLQFDGTDPVILVPGEGRVTIASDDTDALNQLESLLRTIYARGSVGRIGNRDFSIHQLRNTAAADVSATIQQILDGTDGITHFGNVVVVPEKRLNALIVYGNRTDRRRLEPLLEIMDAEKIDNTRAYQTKLVPLSYSRPSRIVDILEGIFKVEMTAGGSRSSIGIPSGVPSEVAIVLRQINAAASAPLLVIEFQRESNSLIIKAPKDLLDEVTQLAMELDQAALTNRAKGVTLLPLKKTSSKQVMKILKNVLN